MNTLCQGCGQGLWPAEGKWSACFRFLFPFNHIALTSTRTSTISCRSLELLSTETAVVSRERTMDDPERNLSIRSIRRQNLLGEHGRSMCRVDQLVVPSASDEHRSLRAIDPTDPTSQSRSVKKGSFSRGAPQIYIYIY